MPLPPAVQERNRKLIAARLGWPDGALDACRQLEAARPGWYAWWSRNPWRRDGKVPPGPAFGAARVDAHGGEPSLYAATPDALAVLVTAGSR